MKNTADIAIIVATHKKYWMPSNPVYVPMHVGRAGSPDLGYTGDNTGDHISEKNKNYCELTGLYWAWKNLDNEYIGLVHYRRHFGKRSVLQSKRKRVLSGKEFEAKLLQTDILLPKPRHYWIETNYSQYAHAHHAIDLDVMREILAEKYPTYIPAFDKVMKRTWGHRFNMFVMKREILDMYCTWLFDLLFELEERLDISAYSDYDARVFGFVAERLLDVWINKNKQQYLDLPYVYLEKQNWILKIIAFLNRKFTLKNTE